MIAKIPLPLSRWIARAFVPIKATHNARYFLRHRLDKGEPDND